MFNNNFKVLNRSQSLLASRSHHQNNSMNFLKKILSKLLSNGMTSCDHCICYTFLFSFSFFSISFIVMILETNLIFDLKKSHFYKVMITIYEQYPQLTFI